MDKCEGGDRYNVMEHIIVCVICLFKILKRLEENPLILLFNLYVDLKLLTTVGR